MDKTEAGQVSVSSRFIWPGLAAQQELNEYMVWALSTPSSAVPQRPEPPDGHVVVSTTCEAWTEWSETSGGGQVVPDALWARYTEARAALDAVLDEIDKCPRLFLAWRENRWETRP